MEGKLKDFLLGLLTRRGWGSPTATVDEAIRAEDEADLLRSSGKASARTLYRFWRFNVPMA